jgi:SAM-dependent methyltransferase
MTTVSRYDPIAELYEQITAERHADHHQRVAEFVLHILGPGPGRCVDVGCGNGITSAAVADTGWRVTGVDLARRLLEHAVEHKRLDRVVCADATRLPFKTGHADAVISTYTHTDIDNWAGAVTAIARVLRPGGRFVYIGPHPCFAGAHAIRGADGRVERHPAMFRDPRLRFDAPGFTPRVNGGLRARVGMHQLTLPRLLGPVLTAGLELGGVFESDEDLPSLIGLEVRKP